MGNWRNTVLSVRLFWDIDGKVALFLPVFLLHIRLWTFCILVLMILSSYYLSQKGYTLQTIKLRIRYFLVGSRRSKWPAYGFNKRSKFCSTEIV